jgi:hypothetical protein
MMKKLIMKASASSSPAGRKPRAAKILPVGPVSGLAEGQEHGGPARQRGSGLRFMPAAGRLTLPAEFLRAATGAKHVCIGFL